MKFSVIIPYSQDYPQLWFTVQDKWLRLMENYTKDDYEIIIVNNGSTDQHLRYARYMSGLDFDDITKYSDRHLQWNSPHRRNLTYIEFPQQLHAKSAINVGAWKARGEIHVHSDSHVLYNNDFFTQAEEFFDSYSDCGILHPSVTWNARVTNVRSYQYLLGFDKQGNRTRFNIMGGWDIRKQSDNPYPIPASGTCSLLVKGDVYKNKYMGYPSALRGYGGGEPYLELLSWMMGDKVYVHPDMLVTHFACTPSRGYHQGGPFVIARNNMLSWYILGGKKWSNRVLEYSITHFMDKHPDWEPVFIEKYREALQLGRMRRKYVKDNIQYTLEDLFQLWDKLGVVY